MRMQISVHQRSDGAVVDVSGRLVHGEPVRDLSEGVRRLVSQGFAEVVIDLSGRPYLVYNVKFPRGSSQIQNIPVSIFDDFFRALSNGAGMNLHINLQYGRDAHHILEGIFKGFGRALRMASELHPRGKGVPSTKGTL